MHIDQVLVISTAHISPEFDSYLTDTRRGAQVGILGLDLGWLIRVNEESTGDEFRNAEFQEQYEAILKVGRQLGVDFVRLDPDADEHPDLKDFNW